MKYIGKMPSNEGPLDEKSPTPPVRPEAPGSNAWHASVQRTSIAV
jgi:hypothetical protein